MGSLAVLECGNYRTNTTVRKSVFHFVCPPRLSHHFLNCRPHQNKTHGATLFRALFFMKTVQQHKTTHITMIRSYKLVAKHSLRHPKRPPHPQTSIGLRHAYSLSGPPTARISLNRRVQLRIFTTDTRRTFLVAFGGVLVASRIYVSTSALLSC